MDRSGDPRTTLRETEQRINWVLENPKMSDWLKTALKTCQDRDPVALLNDLEILQTILQPHAYAKLSILRAEKSVAPSKLH